MTGSRMDEIILKYLNNELESEEARILDQWLQEGNNKLILYNIEMHWLHNQELLDSSKQKVWNKISLPSSIQHAPIVPKAYLFKTWMRAAAVLILGFFIGYFILYMSDGLNSNNVTTVKYLEKISLPGQKINLTLPDGSKVKLNAGSKLIMPEKFDNNRRKVELIGEAYFEVVRDEARPFVIRTRDIKVRVLGTAFNIRAYEDDSSTQVAVTHGKVFVCSKKPKDKYVLEKNQLATFQNDKLIVSDSFNWKELLSWKDQTLYFHEENIVEIIDRLELWYGVTIKLEKKLDMKKDFSGEYRNKSLATVLDGLAYVYEFEYELNEDIVVLK